MEYILPRGRIYFLIIFQMVIFLYTKLLAAEPMWVWTQGCFQANVPPDGFNMSYNLPHTCIESCGPQSMVVALQGNICRCELKSKKFSRTSSCASCEHNSVVTCGNISGGHWSLYKKAKLQELAARGIQTNVTGCVVNKKGQYRVENCSKRGIKSLCKNPLFNGKANCDSKAGKWSPLSCYNSYDNLLDRFVSVQGCRQEYWIGLFSLDDQLSHSMLSDYPQLPLTPRSSFQAESSVLLASVTDRMTSYFTDESSEVMFSSPYDTYVHTEPLSTHLTLVTESSETHLSKVLSILPTTQRYSETSSETSSYLYSSFSGTSPPHIDPSVTFITEILSSLPVLSQSELHSSVTHSMSNKILSIAVNTYISPTNAMLEISSIKYSFTSTSMTSIVPSRTDTYRAASESSFHSSVLSSQRTEMDGISTAAVLASSIVTPVPQQIPPTPSFITQKYSSETDLVVAVAVVGAIAAFSLAAAGVMFVSLSNLKKIVNRTTTFTDDPPHLSRDSSLEGFDETLQRTNTYSDLQGTSFCPRAIRSDFRSHRYRPPFWFNNRPAMENENVPY
ncbi:uncharacterized protein LOC123560055 isoform X2 [Mercenaria mercenaria]|uniref:uncharacterized protein LOC123560055 isoform X2 n=1 Tax=Mercenaria mercenaria TaxID=6596 RepID=UPI00234F6575|nr:uncharacterized protein LOC123560055 isoform X2 [Mercenaria mercenaria]